MDMDLKGSFVNASHYRYYLKISMLSHVKDGGKQRIWTKGVPCPNYLMMGTLWNKIVGPIACVISSIVFTRVSETIHASSW